jgi:peroxiredoxin
MMEKKLAFMLVAALILPFASCTKTQPAAGTAATSTQSESTESTATETPSANVDSEVVQTSATVEEPAQTSASSGKVGATAPAWQNLEGTDGKQHSLGDLADEKVVAVVFTCNTCPVAIAYEDRLVRLANDYQDKGVEIVAINVNKDEANQLPAMKERAEEKGFTFAYLFDPSQQIARDYAATVTPHAFVLNQDRKVVYVGAIDDNQNEAAVQKQHLRDAIDATLAGQTPEVASTEPAGCGIKYE